MLGARRGRSPSNALAVTPPVGQNHFLACVQGIAPVNREREVMREIRRIATTQRRSSVVIYNGMVFIGGQVADDRTQDIRGQTRQILNKIDRFLAEAGTDKSRLLTTQIWIQNIDNDFAGMNEIWDAWTSPGATSTRATAQCVLGLPEILIEIVVTAAVKEEAD